MENKQDYLCKIVYKKSAFGQLRIDLKKYYENKKVLILTTKSVTGNHLTEIVNGVCAAGCEFVQFVAQKNYNKVELTKVADLMIDKNFDLIICFGGGMVCNVAKYFSSVFNIPFFACPSLPSNISYFSSVCVNPYDSSRSFICDSAERIYIQEDVIKTCPKKLAVQGLFFAMAMHELVLAIKLENMFSSENVDYKNMQKILDKIDVEIVDILTGYDDAKLVLMDCIIELGFELEKININSCFNLFNIYEKICKNTTNNFASGENYFLCSRALLVAYYNLFKIKKIYRYEFPNIIKISKIIKNNGVFVKNIKNLQYFNDIFNNKRYLDKLNNLKNEMLIECSLTNQKLENFLNLVKKYNKNNNFFNNQYENIYSSLQVLPFVDDNNFMVNVLGSTGILN